MYKEDIKVHLMLLKEFMHKMDLVIFIEELHLN